MRKFTEVLEEYLDTRDKLNSDQFDGKYYGLRVAAAEELRELTDELDEIFIQVKGGGSECT